MERTPMPPEQCTVKMCIDLDEFTRKPVDCQRRALASWSQITPVVSHKIHKHETRLTKEKTKPNETFLSGRPLCGPQCHLNLNICKVCDVIACNVFGKFSLLQILLTSDSEVSAMNCLVVWSYKIQARYKQLQRDLIKYMTKYMVAADILNRYFCILLFLQ